MPVPSKNFQTNPHKFTKASKPGHYWLSRKEFVNNLSIYFYKLRG